MNALDRKLPHIFAAPKQDSPLDIFKAPSAHVSDDISHKIDPYDTSSYPKIRSLIVRQSRITVSFTLSPINVITWSLLLVTALADLLYVFNVSWPSWLDNNTVRSIHLTTFLALVISLVLAAFDRTRFYRLIRNYVNLEGAARSGPNPLQVSPVALEIDRPKLRSETPQLAADEVYTPMTEAERALLKDNPEANRRYLMEAGILDENGQVRSVYKRS